VDERDPESLYLAGQQEFVEGDAERAVESFRRAILLRPSAKLYHAMGDALLAQVKFSDAASAFREAVRIEPNKRISLMRLGRCLLNSGGSAEAVEVFRRAQALNPDDAEAYREEAAALQNLHREDEAVARLEKAAGLSPSGGDRDFKTVGQIREKQGRYAEAAAAFSRSAELKPDSAVYAQLGEVQVRALNFQGARVAYEEAAKLDSADPWHWEVVGELRERLGERDKAREAFEASLKVKDRPTPHLSLGRLSLLANRRPEAEKELELAMGALGGTVVSEVRDVAAFAMELDRPALAEKLVAMLAGEEDPKSGKKDPELFLELARVRRVLKDAKGVAEACRQAKELLPKDDARPCPPAPSTPVKAKAAPAPPPKTARNGPG
jgi:tetratricopeptide (TPR) repeat protein